MDVADIKIPHGEEDDTSRFEITLLEMGI